MFLQKSNKFWMVLLMVVSLGAAAIVGYKQHFILTNVDGETYTLPMENATIVKSTGEKILLRTEVASTPTDIQVGLMYRKKMDEKHGMIFVLGPPPRLASFWMKNTYIPLDILYIDEKGKVAKIYPDAVPESLEKLPSETPVMAALEINAGLSKEWGIAIGDEIRSPTIARLVMQWQYLNSPP